MFMNQMKSRIEIADKYEELTKALRKNVDKCFHAKDEEEREAAFQAVCTIEGMKFAFKWLMNEDSCDQLNDILNR